MTSSSPVQAQPGAQLWVARYNGPGDFLDVANDVGVSPDSSTVFVTGLSDGRRGSGRYPLLWADFATIAYDAATGSPLWVARYDGPAHRMDSARSVAVSADGTRVLVSGWSITGRTPSGNRRTVYATVAYDALTGQQLWVRRSDLSGGLNYLWASAVVPSRGAVVVTGWGHARGAPTAAETVAYDTATGQVLWEQRANGVQAGYAEAVSPDGATVYVTGVAPRGFGTIAYDSATGEQLWRAVFKPPEKFAEAWAVTVSPDGERVFVTGNAMWRRHKGCYYPDDYTTVAYGSSTGEQLWVARYDGPGRGFDGARDVATSPDGSTVYVTGESSGFGGPYSCTKAGLRTGQDYATIAYDALTGQQLWLQRYDSPKRQGKYDSAHALVVGPDGAVYVTGESHGGGYRDFATVAYAGS